jgi:polyhydroxybutyrate depolymerase
MRGLMGGLLALILGCGGSERPGTLHRDVVLTHDGEDRTYHLYEPSGFEGDRPLVLLLHGGGAVIDNHIGVGRTDWPHQVWLDLADRDGLLVVVPQGLGKQWNDCRTDCGHCGEQDDVDFLLTLLDTVAAEHPVDPARVYVTGESNGSIMTLRLVQEAPERFAAAGVVIGGMPANSECTDPSEVPMPIQFQVGTLDEAVPFEGGTSSNGTSGAFLSAEESVLHWVAHNQCETTPTTWAIDDVDPDDGSTAHGQSFACPATGAEVSWITLENAGHVPPSIQVHVSDFWEGLVGPQNHDVESAEAFWAFMAPHRR